MQAILEVPLDPIFKGEMVTHVTPQKTCPTLGGWIAHIEWVDYKGTHRCAESHIGFLLGENELYK